VIRPATVKDVSSIVNVRLDALTNREISGFTAKEYSLYSLVKKLHKMWGRENVLKDGFRVFVAEENRKIIGFVVFKIENNYGILDNIVVAKENQGKGVGRALVEYVGELAKFKDCKIIKTDTSENAKGLPWKAYGFWIRMGYKDTGERLITKYDFKEIPLIKNINYSNNFH
jgi:ribosomal protein S18 acetylase RimI-like enzyme